MKFTVYIINKNANLIYEELIYKLTVSNIFFFFLITNCYEKKNKDPRSNCYNISNENVKYSNLHSPIETLNFFFKLKQMYIFVNHSQTFVHRCISMFEFDSFHSKV